MTPRRPRARIRAMRKASAMKFGCPPEAERLSTARAATRSSRELRHRFVLYTDRRGRRFESVTVTWVDIEKFLGRPPEGGDDGRLRSVLQRSCRWNTWDCIVVTSADEWSLIGPRAAAAG